MISSGDAAQRVVEAYIRGGSLFEVLETVSDSAPVILRAMKRLRRSLSGHDSTDDALAAAREVRWEEHDPCLAIIFFELWGTVAVKARKTEEAAAVCHRSSVLATDDMPAEIRASVWAMKGMLEVSRANREGRLRCFDEMDRLLPEGSPRRARFLLDRALCLAEVGLGAEAGDDLARAEEYARACGDGLKLAMAAYGRFCTCVEAGRSREARKYLPVVEADRTVAEFGGTRLRLQKLYMELQDGATTRPDDDEPALREVPSYHLLRGDGDAALEAAREWTRQVSHPCICAPHIASWELIRAELSCGHWQAARRLMDLKRSYEHHYLDGLFLARIELRAGHPENAARHFAEALDGAGRHGAEKRIDFELHLARELAPGELVALTRNALSCDRDSAGGPRAETMASSERRGADRLTGGTLERVRSAVRRVANLDATVLISGETGTGKDLAARAIHEESDRREEPFLAVNCAAISENLLETELFGHVKGAFTGAHRSHRGIFEQAGAGTVFLDEIGDMPARLQATLLRVLETGEFRPVGSAVTRRFRGRIVAATHDDLEALVARGAFRSDLLYRLRRMQIAIPPLRQRKEDIPALAGYFLNRDREGTRATLSARLARLLVAYDWPGNVRELRNDVENMRLLNSDIDRYDAGNLDEDVLTRLRGTRETEPSPEVPRNEPRVEQVLAATASPFRRHERLRELFLEYVNLSRAEIVKILGISPATATRDLKRLCGEGFVEKIRPSASPRSHYFTLKPGKANRSILKSRSGSGRSSS